VPGLARCPAFLKECKQPVSQSNVEPCGQQLSGRGWSVTNDHFFVNWGGESSPTPERLPERWPKPHRGTSRLSLQELHRTIFGTESVERRRHNGERSAETVAATVSEARENPVIGTARAVAEWGRRPSRRLALRRAQRVCWTARDEALPLFAPRRFITALGNLGKAPGFSAASRVHRILGDTLRGVFRERPWASSRRQHGRRNAAR
jgi:hypothetical protein